MLAVILGANLVSAAGRFATAWDAYDRLGLELTEFHYAGPDSAIRAVFVVSNPSDETVEVREIELRVNAGVHRVGGGQIRPQTDPEAAGGEVEAKYRLDPGESQEYRLALAISDSEYLARLGADDVDWRVNGRILVQVDEGLDPEWIPFVVRYVPVSRR